MADELGRVYRQAIYRSTPPLLVQRVLDQPEVNGLLREPVSVVSVGKAASSLLKGAAAVVSIDRAFAALPEGYRQDEFPPYAQVVYGSHPEVTRASFEAADELIRFLDGSHRPVLFLISGGASACLAKPLEPWFDRDDLVRINRTLVRSGLPIEKMNVVRKHLSGIKGGRLGQLLPEGSITLVLSDVSRGHWGEVGSGPTVADPSTNEEAIAILGSLDDDHARELAARLASDDVPETVKSLPIPSFLLGDNGTLVSIAGEIVTAAGLKVAEVSRELNGDVGETAEILKRAIRDLAPGTVVVAGGEPTVRVEGSGRGGRCSEIAVRLGRWLQQEQAEDVYALLGSSDGRDGSAEAAGYVLEPGRYRRESVDPERWQAVLDNSDTWSIVGEYARILESRATGNNLRDIFLLARA